MEILNIPILIPILIAALLFFMYRMNQRIRARFENYDTYLFEQRSNLNRDDLMKLLKRDRAQLQAMIKVKEEKGLMPDPLYAEVLKKVEAELAKMDKNLY